MLLRLFEKSRKPKDAPIDRLERLEARVDDLERESERLEAALEYASDDLKKLRGRVTGGLRMGKSSEDAPGSTNDGGVPVYLSPAWFAKRKRELLHKEGQR